MYNKVDKRWLRQFGGKIIIQRNSNDKTYKLVVCHKSSFGEKQCQRMNYPGSRSIARKRSKKWRVIRTSFIRLKNIWKENDCHIFSITKRMYTSQEFRSCVLELNASDDRGINVVRQTIQDFVSTKNLFGKTKLVILDEADSMTNDAQNALRRIIEKYTATARFCIICNYINSIIPAIQSRCTKFRFSPLPADHMKLKLAEISKCEKVNIEEKAFAAIIKLSHGDMRHAVNILQSLSLSFSGEKKIKLNDIYSTKCYPNEQQMKLLLHVLLNDDFRCGVNKIQEYINKYSFSLYDIVQELSDRLLTLSLPQVGKIQLYDDLARLELRLRSGTNVKVQASSLIAAFHRLRYNVDGLVEEQLEKKNYVKKAKIDDEIIVD
ncbi:hypothetical protein SNEBB_010575 [Seison nebaliae]|nr:hypothetical protein SNEBB_010575 [Seison nebaliae]